MIVTCQACHKRYLIEHDEIGMEGRQVRCMACGHSWSQRRMDEVLNILPSKPTTFDPGYISGHHAAKRFPWLVVTGVLTLTVFSLYLARGPLVAQWPSLGKMYTAFKIPVHAPFDGLILENVSSFQGDAKAAPTYALKGELINESDAIKPLPVLKITARGQCQRAGLMPKMTAYLKELFMKIKGRPGEKKPFCELESWSYELTQSRIGPGQRLFFETPPRLTRQGTETLSIEF